MFQLSSALLTTFINLFCLSAVIFSKELHKLDFYMVTLQTVFDFLFTGLYNCWYCYTLLMILLNTYCFNATYVTYITEFWSLGGFAPPPSAE